MKKMELHGVYASATDIGRIRLSNEDMASSAINAKGEILLAVADGMGGANKGDYASRLAVDSLFESFSKKPKFPFALFDKFWLSHAFSKANRIVYGASQNSPLYKGMGTTLVAALLTGHKLIVANVGDSRCYGFGEGGLKRLTEDQTYVSYLLRTGKITAEEAAVHPDRHVLMNALGIYPSLSVSISVFDYSGESILCCTDGLYNALAERDIASVLHLDERTDQKVNTLVKMANDAGGSDNIGVSLWEKIDD